MRKGFSLIAALIVLVIVTITVAALGKFFIGSLKVGSQLRVYKTTKEAVQSMATTVINKLDSGELSDCKPPPSDQCKDLDHSYDCTDKALDTTIKQALEASGITNYKIYLLSYCNGLYLFEVIAQKQGDYTRIIFAYQE